MTIQRGAVSTAARPGVSKRVAQGSQIAPGSGTLPNAAPVVSRRSSHGLCSVMVSDERPSGRWGGLAGSALASRAALETAALVAAMFGVGCRAPRAAAGAQPDGGPVMLVPSAVAPVGGRSASGREIDAPIAWFFLPQWPVTTGSSPDVIAAAALPCGFRAMYSTVDRDGASLRVRIRARFTGAGSPPSLTTPCTTEPPSLQFASLNRVRLGEYTIVDASRRANGDDMIPSLQLSVVRDDESAPSEAERWVRGCAAGDDRACATRGGGVCGSVRETPGRGVCVPPLDPFLVVGRPCPERTTEVALDHPEPYATAVAPPPGPLRACLTACNAEGRCPSGLQCVRRSSSSAGACVR